MKLFMRRFGKIDPADTKTVVMLMLKLNDLVCDGLMSAAALDNEITVASRIKDHNEVQNRIKEQKKWGGVNKMKLQEEKKKRREFTYAPVSLEKYQKQFLINFFNFLITSIFPSLKTAFLPVSVGTIKQATLFLYSKQKQSEAISFSFILFSKMFRSILFS